MTTAYDFSAKTLDGAEQPLSEFKGKPMLIVNTASKCGFTRQYAGLEALYERYRHRGLAVLGFPCNQFGGQEPGSADEIAEFCSRTYGVSFPMFDKVKVNGRSAHPLYQELTKTPDAEGKAGRVKWNFEKFVVTPSGDVHRFRPTTEPDDPAIVGVIEAALPQG